MVARSQAAHAAACEQVRARYDVRTRDPFGGGSVVWVRQLHDRFSLHPITRHGGCGQTQCAEATRLVGVGGPDREIGETVLEMLNRPNVAVDHAAKVDPFVGRILPHIDLPAMEAELRRHRAG